MQREVHIPDGGWGWVIVACSFLIHMFVVGTVYALSVLYVAWLDYFGDGKGLTSWIISLAAAVMFGIGPVPGSLSKRFGNRAVVIAGGFVMFVGFVASYFAMSIYFLVVSIGIVTGTGAGCCYLPSVSMVAMYFTTKRSVAMGIAASGLGVGAFCMAPFLNWLEFYYGWRGCMLILGGISLNMCVLGALMRPLETAPNCDYCRPRKDGDLLSVNFSSLSKKSFAAGECNTSEVCVEEVEEHCDELCLNNHHHNNCVGACRRPSTYPYSPLPTSDTLEVGVSPVAYFPAHPAVVNQHESSSMKTTEKLVKENTNHIANCDSHSDMPHKIFVDGHMEVPLKIHLSADTMNKDNNFLKETSNSEKLRNQFLHVDEIPSYKIGRSMEILPSARIALVPLSEKKYSSHADLRNKQSLLQPSVPAHQDLSLNDMQIMLAGSVGSLLFMEKTWQDNSVLSLRSKNSAVISHHQADLTSAASVHGYELTFEEIENPEDDEEETYCSRLVASLRVYFTLLRNGTFILFSISNFLTNLSFLMPVLYMVDRALDNGIDRAEAAMLISLYGAGNIFGKLFFGWLADRDLLDRLFYYIACLTICGASTCLSPLCGSSHELHSVYAFVFGGFIGAYVTLYPVVIVDLMGLSNVVESFGLLLFFMGIATAFGTPLAGWIFDWTGSYTISFILHGAFILLSALMLIPLLLLKRRRKDQNHQLVN